MTDKYVVYTDGACSNNQGYGGQPGGWGVVFLDGREFSGRDDSTTNNRMELTAAIEALRNTPKGSEVQIHSDSAYVINGFNQNWIKGWIRKGWINSQGKPVENQDLWKTLLSLEQDRKVEWIKVKGHSGDKWNELADRLAVHAMENSDSGRQSGKGRVKYVNLTLSEEQFHLLLNNIKKLANTDDSLDVIYQELLKQQKV